MEHEKLNIMNNQHETIGTAARSDIHAEGLWHETFHFWLLKKEDDTVFLYFQLRSPAKKISLLYLISQQQATFSQMNSLLMASEKSKKSLVSPSRLRTLPLLVSLKMKSICHRLPIVSFAMCIFIWIKKSTWMSIYRKKKLLDFIEQG